MKRVTALAHAGLSRLADGEWRLHSRFSQAVNYCRADGALLTLFRYGKGMGPTGILLSRRDFSQMACAPFLVKRGEQLWWPGGRLKARRPLCLKLFPGALAPLSLSGCSRQSGLGLPLSHPLTALPVYHRLFTELDNWFAGQEPDWSWLIGRGPGLTPSGDDILTGVMAVLTSAGFSRNLRSCPFLPAKDRLVLLTTSVSCSYLNSAIEGEFSTPVLQLMRCLQSDRDPRQAIRRVLSIGHTSGADMLLGVALAQQWLRVMLSRRTHARSGNDTYIYSGC
ncbi:oxamate carbamoyltransferase subunit AllH family protein [Pseudocitrobacter cyperus]|uniref:DUF2877 domain-containing protein n=1 Tax=Pseudocitrobacter cyperus TaxID=3112843 RepID=A0ABV0HJE7_9ENTR